ncbi:Secreted protein [Streptomyces sp. PVA_94-07]|uniref:SGNH/GDSL hydrolase family protein n=1 Tax=Streptomyces sp. PVA_94-07 TaxID=1225337 RepID=UPI0003C30400|nr:SGNH/GDSL hydrolase family protein [Streptomyces sp. PVA_94-07]ESQ06849.1 Secreted protein [Streptomyces sp. PVA_94-07]
MRRQLWGSALVLALITSAAPLTSAGAAEERGPRPLRELYDNRAVSEDGRPGAADFDGQGRSLPAAALRAVGWQVGARPAVEGTRLDWPVSGPGRPDNVRARGQRVAVEGRGDALTFLVAGTGGEATGIGTVHYRDGGHSRYRLTAPDWRTGPLATKAVALPYLNSREGRVEDRPRLYVVTVPLDAGRTVESVRLPHVRGPGRSLHVFDLRVRPATEGWTGSWSASTSGLPEVGPWRDQTLRLVVHPTKAGPTARVRLSNTFAGTPVRVGRATVAVRAQGAEPRSTPVPLTFGGQESTVLPAGAEAVSDPVGLAVEEGVDLLVSLHLPAAVPSVPLHDKAVQKSYLSTPGDHAADADGTAYTGAVGTWPLLTGVDVSGGPGSVVVLGDSITEGVGTTEGANKRWTDALARRLHDQDRVPRYGVLNQGISANRVLGDRYPGDGVSSDTGGVSALHRLDRDLLSQTSVRTVVLFEGINDVRWGARADEVVDGLRQLAERARARGVRVVVTTLAPCEGESRCTPAVDAQRSEVNRALRADRDSFDAVLDFDRVLRDPGRPARMLPAYDSGDHLHPGEAGLQALADAVDLTVLDGRRGRAR